MGALLLLCLVHGITVQRDVRVPPDVDSLRDLGFIQALRDGNYWGDPSYAGEWRYYPPLVHVIVAAAAHIGGIEDLALFWTRAGLWLNLLTPLAFFLMCRGVFAANAPAFAATCVYVLWLGSMETPWVMGGYTPWPLTPSIAQTFFFLSILAIVTSPPPSSHRASLLRAALIGVLIGLSALAHLVPALILAGVVTVAAFSRTRRAEVVAWLGVVALVALATAAPYLATSVLFYPNGIVNDALNGYADATVTSVNRLMLINAPGVLALAAALVLARRRRDIAPTSAVALLAWIGICAVPILRHQACTHFPRVGQAVGCDVYVLTAHHYHLYLQSAWACLMGYVAWAAVEVARQPGRARWLRPAIVTVLLCVLALGVRSFLRRDYDQRARQAGSTEGGEIDLQAYRWVLANTAPRDVFVTDLQGDWHAPAAFTVMAAGRQVVAAPVLFSNPFVDWTERNARRQAYMDAALLRGTDDQRLCDLARGAQAYLLLPRDVQPRSPRLQHVHATAYHAAYRVSREGCGPLASAVAHFE